MPVKAILSKNWLPLPQNGPKMGSRHLLRRSSICHRRRGENTFTIAVGLPPGLSARIKLPPPGATISSWEP